MTADLRIRELGCRDYRSVWQQMQQFTGLRSPTAVDELWLVQHPPVFTLGQAGKHEHVLDPGDIPVISVDRGGQVTYHGPGQLLAYVLLDLRRLGIGVRALVETLELSVTDWLADRGVIAAGRREAPGVYVDGAKIAALGLRVKRGCSYHGLSFNVDMDLEPFSRINPCGYAGMPVTQLRDLGIDTSLDEVARSWSGYFAARLGYNQHYLPQSTGCDQ